MPWMLILMIAINGFTNPADENTTKANATDTRSRTFELSYGAEITGVPAGASVKAWLPIPQSNPLQKIKRLATQTPAPMALATEPTHGNQIGFFELKATDAPISFTLDYEVIRHEAKLGDSKVRLSDAEKQKYLKANRLVPTTGRPIELIEGVDLANKPLPVSRQLYDIVDAYMKYDKSKPGYGNGDVLWACDSKTGNCTDFHSLFISLARHQNIPARFEIGFPIPKTDKATSLGGYHCWAWFYTDAEGWVGVDISEADKHPELKDYYFGHLGPDRVAFSVGRDIVLTPPAKTGPLNYFVYPHIEVDGKLWPKEKIKLHLNYRPR